MLPRAVPNEHGPERLCLNDTCQLPVCVDQRQATAHCPFCGGFGWGYADTVALHAGALFYAQYTGQPHDDVLAHLDNYHVDTTALFHDLLNTGRVAADQPYDVQVLVYEQIANDIDPQQALAAARAVLR